MNSSNIPDILYDKNGKAYNIIKPHKPDSDMWVRIYPKDSLKL